MGNKDKCTCVAIIVEGECSLPIMVVSQGLHGD